MITIFDQSLVGTVVKSSAGRDRKRVFIVIGTAEAGTETKLVVTDGRLRPTGKPKSKNPLHVKPIAHLTEEETKRLVNADDKTVREILANYDEYMRTDMQAK